MPMKKGMAFKEYRLLSPAKLNFVLRIAPPRRDGFHPIESLMVKLNWGDGLKIHLRSSDRLKIKVEAGLTSIASEKNICWKACEKFSTYFQTYFEAQIQIKKNIPMQAGLGGGSSNAATVLLALAKWKFGAKISSQQVRDDLHHIASGLGSDLNLFLSETNAAWCTGRGEIVEPKNLPSRPIVLVFPKTKISTPWAYRHLDEVRRGRADFSFRGFEGYSQSWEEESFEPQLRNDFQGPSLEKFAELRQVLQDLCLSGATTGQMTGSGSCFFGVYRSEALAKKAARFLMDKGRRVQLCWVAKA